MDTQLTDEQVRQHAEDPAATEADVEGHSVFAAIAASGALRARSQRDREMNRSKADETLPPLSKPFPSMRDDRRK